MSVPQQGGGLIEHEDQLAGYLASGCKPPQAFRIGTEHEKFGFDLATRQPLPYAGPCSIRAMMEGLRDRFGWAEVREGENLIGLTRNGASVSLEPGGQFELSGAAVETLHETAAELDTHLAEVAEIAGPMGAGFLGIGATPDWQGDQMPVMPKGRYALMTRYMGKVGTHGTQMMYRTCTVQVNLDYESEADMVRKLRVGIALQPLATALFATSPFFDGRPNGHLSWRSRIWRDLDAARTGMLPFVFGEGMGFEAYVQYALDVPMYFVYRDGRYIDALGQSFRDFLNGTLPALPGERPTLSDWADHLTTLFPEARVKKFIETRGADCGPRDMIVALPAFWVGLFYHPAALDAAWDIAKGWTAADRDQLRIDASVKGLRAEIRGRTLQDIGREVLALSVAGLAARGRRDVSGRDETRHLAPLHAIVESGRTRAEDLLALWQGDWKGDITRVYEAARL